MAKTISSLAVSLGAGIAPFAQQMNGAVGVVQSAVGKIKSISGSIGTGILQGIGQGIAGGVGKVVSAIGAGLGKGFNLAADMEQTTVAMETMLGSADNAKALIGQLTKFGAETPFEFPELAESAKKLLAFGISADKILPSLKNIGDVASGLNVPINELSEIFGKAKVAGTLMSEDINELMGRGVPVIKEFAKQLGVSEGQVKKMASEGKISFDMLEKAFASMAGEGGQFGGMMAKQSQTVKGLMSTLSDSVGNALMKITQGLFDAFNIKAAIGGLSGFIGGATDSVVAYVATAVTMLKAVGSSVWGFIQGVWSAVTPTLVSIGQGIVWAFEAGYSGAVAMLSAMANFVTTTFNAIYSAVSPIVSTLWWGITEVFAWGAKAMGISTANAAGEQTSLWQNIVNILIKARDAITYALNATSFAIENFGRFANYVWLNTSLGVVKFANQVEYFFGTAIPYSLGYLKRNWLQIFGTIANYTATVFTNLFGNIGKLIKNLPALLKGSMSVSDLWTPLTDGFKDAITEAFVLPERQVGALESSLAERVTKLGGELSNDFAAYMKEKENTAKSIADTLKTGAKDIAKEFATAPEKLKPAEAPVLKVDPVAKGPEAPAAAKGEKKDNKALLVGSAEAMRAAFDAPQKTTKNLQKDMVKKQETTNTLIGQLIGAVERTGGVKLVSI